MCLLPHSQISQFKPLQVCLEVGPEPFWREPGSPGFSLPGLWPCATPQKGQTCLPRMLCLPHIGLVCSSPDQLQGPAPPCSQGGYPGPSKEAFRMPQQSPSPLAPLLICTEFYIFASFSVSHLFSHSAGPAGCFVSTLLCLSFPGIAGMSGKLIELSQVTGNT
jgi:hypothetical protein